MPRVVGRVGYYIGNDGGIYLRGVFDDGFGVVVSEWFPYAFARADVVDKLNRLGVEWEKTDLRDEYGNRVVRFWVKDPKRVAFVRDRVGYDVTYEADIP